MNEDAVQVYEDHKKLDLREVAMAYQHVPNPYRVDDWHKGICPRFKNVFDEDVLREVGDEDDDLFNRIMDIVGLSEDEFEDEDYKYAAKAVSLFEALSEAEMQDEAAWNLHRTEWDDGEKQVPWTGRPSKEDFSSEDTYYRVFALRKPELETTEDVALPLGYETEEGELVVAHSALESAFRMAGHVDGVTDDLKVDVQEYIRELQKEYFKDMFESDPLGGEDWTVEENQEDEENELDKVYSEWDDAVNMTASELREWSRNPCSREASVDPHAVIKRNLSLLEKNKDEWTDSDIEDAQRTVSFINRMSSDEMTPDEPRDGAKGCPSDWAISLLNWAYNPFDELPGTPEDMDSVEAVTLQEKDPEDKFDDVGDCIDYHVEKEDWDQDRAVAACQSMMMVDDEELPDLPEMEEDEDVDIRDVVKENNDLLNDLIDMFSHFVAMEMEDDERPMVSVPVPDFLFFAEEETAKKAANLLGLDSVHVHEVRGSMYFMPGEDHQEYVGTVKNTDDSDASRSVSPPDSDGGGDDAGSDDGVVDGSEEMEDQDEEVVEEQFVVSPTDSHQVGDDVVSLSASETDEEFLDEPLEEKRSDD